MENELKPLLTAILIFTAIFCVYAAIASSIPMVIQDSYNQSMGGIYGPKTIGQSFVATENGLNRIDIMMATYARINTENVIFHIRQVDSINDTITLTVNAEKIMNNRYQSFIFEPIPDSKEKSYIFSIQSPESRPGNSVTIWYNTEEAYYDGTAILNDTPIQGDLSFRAYYRVSKLDLLSFFLEKFLKDTIFAVTYLTLLIVIIFGIIWLQKKERKREESE